MITFRSTIFLLCFAIAAAGQTDIRGIDLLNFTYPAYCASEETEQITVKNGEFSYEKQEDGYIDRFYFKVYSPQYGDLDGDGLAEAVVISVCNTGGTGNFSEGYIFGMRQGMARLLARIPGGDRADGGLRTATVTDGLLVVESNDTGELGGACCPEFIITSKYRLSGERLVPVGSPVKRPVMPTSRLRFDRGKSGKTFKITLGPDEGRRYTVGAKAAQELVVIVDSDQVGLRLLEDAPLTYGINNFLARLPQTGDYTVELQNNSDKPLEITVNVRIQ